MRKQETKEIVRTATKAAIEASGPPTRAVLRVILIVLAVIVTLWIVVKLTGVILLLILSIFFAYFVAPLVEFLVRPIRIGSRQFLMPRSLAIMFAYLILIGVVVIGLYVLVPRLGNQFPEFAEQARGYWKVLTEKAKGIDEYFRQRMPGTVVDKIKNNLPHVINAEETFKSVAASMWAWLGHLPWLILIPVLSFFLLKDVETFRRSALQMLPRGRWRWRADEFFQDVNSTLAAYIRAQLTACLFIGVVCAIGFTVLGLPSPLVLGVIAAVCEFVPLVGPLLVLVVAALAGLLHGGLFSAFLVIVFLAVLRVVQDYVVYPRLIGQGIHLHPLAVIMAILCGAELAGIAGIFLAIPVVAILTVSYRHWLEHRGSEGFADLLEPTPAEGVAVSELYIPSENDRTVEHPDVDTTPEDMARERPDLTTGELKMPGGS